MHHKLPCCILISMTPLKSGTLDLALLSALDGPPRYGLEILHHVNGRSAGLFDLREGSLYPALHRLERAGFLGSDERQPPRGGPVVRYYRLTAAGRADLNRRREAYVSFDRAVRALW